MINDLTSYERSVWNDFINQNLPEYLDAGFSDLLDVEYNQLSLLDNPFDKNPQDED